MESVGVVAVAVWKMLNLAGRVEKLEAMFVRFHREMHRDSVACPLTG